MIPYKNENTPIHYLAKKGVMEVLDLDKELLTIKNMWGCTPIHWMAQQGVKEVLKLDKELLMIKNVWGYTPVHYLAYRGVKISEEYKELI